MHFCNIIIYSYHYLLDPKISERVSNELSKDCIVVFDEAHNIDNVCIESLSTDITEESLRKATRGAQNLEKKINEIRETDQQQLEDEYRKLVEGLRGADEVRQEDAFVANPGKSQSARKLLKLLLTVRGLIALPDDLLKEAVPGNIRRAEHFVAFLKRFIEYLKVRMATPTCCGPDLLNCPSDAYESTASHFGDTALLLGTLEGVHFHRQEAS
jgi:DNA excision repair protein ERCC-2